MKQCPKCSANINDTAKFCIKCGCNIKKYEEEHAAAQEIFCPECGTKFSGGSFCPECGYNVSEEANASAEVTDVQNSSAADSFGDFFAGIESSTDAAVEDMKIQEELDRQMKALSVFEYEENGDGTYIILGIKNKNAVKIVVPEGVVAIADNAFEECEALSIILPESLIKIGDAAFKNAKDLASINLPEALLSIGDEAFAGCESLDITIPATVRKIGQNALLDTVQDRMAREAEEARVIAKKKEAEEKARQEAEEKARQEAEEKARQEAEEKARQEAEEKARQESEEKERRLKSKRRYFRELYSGVASELKYDYERVEYGFFDRVKSRTVEERTATIQWLLIDADDEKALLIADTWPVFGDGNSVFGDYNYVNRYKEIGGPLRMCFRKGDPFVAYTWENSYIRSWLNGKFYSGVLYKAFGDRILNTTLDNGDDMQTEDRVFLLSEDEHCKYIGAIMERSKRIQEKNKVGLRSVEHIGAKDKIACFEYVGESKGYNGAPIVGVKLSKTDSTDFLACLPAFWVKHTDEMLKKIQKDREQGKLTWD